MSVAEVQARMSELQLRIAALASGPPAGTVGSEQAFATTLDQVSSGTSRLSPTAFTNAAVGSATRAVSASTSSVTGDDVVSTARQFLGTPYVWGGEDPSGFDCSGLIQYVYGKFGVDLPRVSTDQAKAGTAVSPAEARPGDLVYFDNTGRPDHIGIYAGNGTWVVAPKTGDVVKVQAVDLSKASSIRRVLPETSGFPSAARALSATPSWAAALPAKGQAFAAGAEQAAATTGVDARLLAAVAWQESDFNPKATSPAGAVGLMQLMPATAAGLGVDPTDPTQALEGGGRYLADQIQRFGGRLDLGLAAYNAGPSAVRKHGGIPPYAETQKYVTSVLDRYRLLGGRA